LTTIVRPERRFGDRAKFSTSRPDPGRICIMRECEPTAHLELWPW
jgi:hypothetical protein